MTHSRISVAAALLLGMSALACQSPPGRTASQANGAADSVAPDTAPVAPQQDTSLTSGEWALVALGGQPAPLGAGDRPATMIFTPGTNRVTGFSGCNRASGSYQLNGTTLTFGPLIMTRMACDKGMELEQRYAATMDSTRGYRLTADTLELLGTSGTVIARFERRTN